MAHLPDKTLHHFGLLDHEQDTHLMAFVRSRLQRPGGRRIGRLGLGAGDDRVHVVGRLAYRRARSSSNFFSRCHYLSGCSLDDGVYDCKMAGACRRVVSVSDRRSAWHTGAHCRHAPLLDCAATLNLLLDDLHGDERWLSDRWQHFRLRAPFVRRVWLFKSPWIAHNNLPDTIPGKPQLRGTASADDLFSEERS